MPTHRMSILGRMMPDSSGDVFFEPADIKMTTAPWGQLVLIFKDTSTRIGATYGFTVPKNYVGAPKIVIAWTANATSGDFDADCDYRNVGGNDTESLNQSGTQESATVNDIAPSAAYERMEALIALTAGNFAVDDFHSGELFRDGVAEGGGGIAAPIIVIDVLFEYSDA